MKIIQFTIALLTIYSCHEQSPKVLTGKKTKSNIEYFAGNMEQIIVSDSLQPIVDSLTRYGIIESESIGYSGAKSDIYVFFEKLVTLSTDAELIELTNHNIPSMRSYAFWALAKKRNPVVKEIILEHLNDTSTFWMMSGCSLDQKRVNNFYLMLLTPNYIDSECLKLSSKEISYLKSEIQI